jgi:hypothetical protein
MKNNDYNLNDEPNFPLENNDKNLFGLPSNYFESFEDKLREKIDLQDELEQFPILSSIEKNNMFEVPANYFISSENSLEYKTELDAYFKLQSIKKPVFEGLEEDYKQQLQSSITHKIEIVEELKDYKLLYSLNKENSFTVSENYFEGVATRVKERIFSVNEDRKSIIDIVLDAVFGKAMAFSFGLCLIIGLSVFFYQTPENIIESGDCKTLACLERNEILNNNKVITNFDEDQLMDLVDVNTLNQQLNSKKESREEVTKTDNVNLDSISADDLLDEL